MLSAILTNPVFDVVVMLGTLVFIHEFGHYAAAKLFGVRVEVFSLGFGKRLFGFRRGDTDYRVSALPLGGYVKMSGENPMEESTGDPGEFMAHPRWQRFIIALAGPAMNVVLAIVVMTGVFTKHYARPYFLDRPAVIIGVEKDSEAAKAGLQANDRIVAIDGVNAQTWETVATQMAINVGQPLHLEVQRGNETLAKEVSISSTDVDPLDQLGITPSQPFQITDIVEGAPAEKAGIQQGDEVLSVDGKPVRCTEEFTALLQETKDKPVALQLKRDGRLLTLTVKPELKSDGDGKSHYRVGFGSFRPAYAIPLPLSQAFAKSVEWNKDSSLFIVEVLKKLVRRPAIIKNFSSPIGIAKYSERAAREGFLAFVSLMALISLNLGIFNLLPIPILDGGLILLLFIEGIMRRNIRREVKERVYQAAFVFLIVFAAVVIYNDITKTAFGHWLHM
jgi:regulator of sigma E protease